MKKDLKCKIQSFFDDMMAFSVHPEFKFFHQTKTHWMLTCLVAVNNEGGISFEEICSILDRKISSRSTIQRILDNGLSIGFFTKSPSESDKRLQMYRLSKSSEKHMVAWGDRQAEIFR